MLTRKYINITDNKTNGSKKFYQCLNNLNNVFFKCCIKKKHIIKFWKSLVLLILNIYIVSLNKHNTYRVNTVI